MSKEIRNGLKHCLEQGKRAVLATIIQVTGSAYRREGARCLIYESGEVIGILSGGCVESDLAEHAQEVLQSGLPKRVEYDFRWQEDEIWGLGLGCNGALSVWMQPVDPLSHRQEAEALLEELQRRTLCTEPYLYTVVVESSNPSALPPGTIRIQTLTNEQLEEQLKLRKLRVPQKSDKSWEPQEKTVEPEQEPEQEEPGTQKHSERVGDGNGEGEGEGLGSLHNSSTGAGLVNTGMDGIQVTLFVEHVQPLPRLAVIGSGPDAALLAKRAADLEWKVSVIDHREAYLNAYFPDAERVLIPRGDYASVPLDPRSYAVVMTHNLDLDQFAVRALLQQNIPYIGVLGSRQRIGRIMEMVGQTWNQAGEAPLENIYSPVGLDIGAQTPEEITLSILAELTAHKNSRKGGFLRQPVRIPV